MCRRAISVFVAAASCLLAQSVEHFETKIRPVLAARCYACHSGQSGKPQAGLRLDTSAGIRQGGNSGALIDKDVPERSVLLRALSHQDKELKMPPGKPLPAETIAEFEKWVRAGAPVPEDRQVSEGTKKGSGHWSFVKPEMPNVPQVRDAAWARNDIDRFILAKLEERSLQPSKEADKRTLIRRLTYDLTGLPPTAAEVNTFLADKAPDAYERLVDRLLASPQYGERWARHWLDVARYSDSRDVGDRFAWSYTYRDWVIRSLNEDLPYDQFLVQQLAADRLKDNDKRHLAALGFVSLGREFPKIFPETVDDRIDTVTRGMLGLTVACARCHDHKYDPIPTKDYYSLYSVFSNIREPETLPLIGETSTPTSKQQLYEARLAKIREIDHAYRVKRHKEMLVFFKSQIAEYLIAANDSATLSNTATDELVRERQLNLYLLQRWREYLASAKRSNDPVFRAWHAAVSDVKTASTVSGSHPLVAAEVRNAQSLKEVAEKYAALLMRFDGDAVRPNADEEALRLVLRGPTAPLNVPLSEFEEIYTEGDGNNTRSLFNQYKATLALYAYDGGAQRAMAIEDVPNPKVAHVFLRGNANNPGVETPGRFLTCLSKGEPQVFRDGSGRLELARAIASEENPLTARVAVNRVWMHHFGQGLVRTPSDFGLRGEKPSHPELLDYLAVSFMKQGWSMKKLHRMILLSATYRQSSADNPEARKVDAENQLLWRMNRRRLDFESLRDSMLAVSGVLDGKIGGTPFLMTARPSIPRRTIYGFVERGRVPAMLSVFDFPSPDSHAPTRFLTTVPQQALFLMNNTFVVEQAKYTVARLDIAAQREPRARIDQLYRVVFARDPKPAEVEAGVRFLAATDEVPVEAQPESPWQHGTGAIDDTGRTTDFKPFRYFTGDAWQDASMLPDPVSGSARLRANGGEPGTRPVVRRWVSPVDGTVNVEGTLRHGQRTPKMGDGVRGRLISSRLGELASWVVDGRAAETRMNGIEVQKGDTLDFVVDGRNDAESDDFSWAPTVTSSDKTAWKATEGFVAPPPERLSKWEQYAQALLETNEFAFVD